nr:glycosyltransferase [Bacteroides intestinalis]
MKVLIINKFLYSRGGDCIYALNLSRLLCNAGHETCFYAMDYSHNIPCKESKYFAEEIDFSATNLFGKIKAVSRIIWGTGVTKSFEKLLDEFQPSIVYLNNIHSYLSPIVAKIACKKGIKVIWTLHDYKLICPSYNCLCNGKVCEVCLTNKKNVVLRKCMKNNLLASVLAWGEAVNWNKDKLSAWTDTFICPSHFMANKMQQGGYPADKLQVISNFIGEEQAEYIKTTTCPAQEKAYAYIGRLSREKGIDSLLKAASQLPYRLYIAGTGPLEAELKKEYTANNIVFLGHLTMEDTINLLRKVCFTVIPSVCYENNPLSVIESLCCGTPVLGRDIGGIPELLESDNCNLLFTQDEALPALITKMFDTVVSNNRNELSATSLRRFSSEQYYRKWLKIVE